MVQAMVDRSPASGIHHPPDCLRVEKKSPREKKEREFVSDVWQKKSRFEQVSGCVRTR